MILLLILLQALTGLLVFYIGVFVAVTRQWTHSPWDIRSHEGILGTAGIMITIASPLHLLGLLL